MIIIRSIIFALVICGLIFVGCYMICKKEKKNEEKTKL